MTLSHDPNRILARIGRRIILAALLSFMAALPARATTLDDYRKSLESTQRLVGQLLESVARSELGQRDVKRERDVIAQIRKELPATEKIEWQGGSVETANQWLNAKLDAFQDEADSTKRAVMLTGISERLAAIGKKIDELENPTVAGRSKDEDKQKLAEILRREEYQKPQIIKEQSLFQKWLGEFLAWIARVFPHANIVPGTSSGFGSLAYVLQILIYAIVIALVGFVLYKFAPFLARRFGIREKKEEKDRVILGERIASDKSAEDLFAEAERLAREGDLRGAIRKGYVALLCELSDRKIIGLARYKTNRDYLRDVSKRTDIFENVAGLTGNFERNWYGLRPSEQGDWEEFRAGYRRTIASV